MPAGFQFLLKMCDVSSLFPSRFYRSVAFSHFETNRTSPAEAPGYSTDTAITVETSGKGGVSNEVSPANISYVHLPQIGIYLHFSVSIRHSLDSVC